MLRVRGFQYQPLRDWLWASLAVLLALPLAGCSERSSPWESKEARTTSEAIEATVAALADSEPAAGGAMLQPARGPALPVSALPERLRPGAAPPKGSAPVPEPPPLPVVDPAPPPPRREEPHKPPAPKESSPKPVAGSTTVDVGEPYGELDWDTAISLIQSPRTSARLLAARVLGQLALTAEQVKYTRERLRAASQDEDEGVRKAAEQALKKVGK